MRGVGAYCSWIHDVLAALARTRTLEDDLVDDERTGAERAGNATHRVQQLVHGRFKDEAVVSTALDVVKLEVEEQTQRPVPHPDLMRATR